MSGLIKDASRRSSLVLLKRDSTEELTRRASTGRGSPRQRVLSKSPDGEQSSTEQHFRPASELFSDDVGVRDLASLMHLDEAAILKQLSLRYAHDIIYTAVGDILVALNPFKEIDSLYGEVTSRRYYHDVDTCNVPHVFGVAQRAYKQLLQVMLGGLSWNKCLFPPLFLFLALALPQTYPCAKSHGEYKERGRSCTSDWTVA